MHLIQFKKQLKQKKTTDFDKITPEVWKIKESEKDKQLLGLCLKPKKKKQKKKKALEHEFDGDSSCC